jgi:hypothetical protein
VTSHRRRGRPTRSVSDGAPKRQLLVFVEGARTEEEYIVYWHRLHRKRVGVTIADDRGVPKTLVELAVAAKAKGEREERRGRGAAWDEVWCVFDTDSHPNLHEALEMARTHGVRVAVSNPCLELWFLLHFEDQTAYIERREAQSRARSLLKCDKGLSDTALDALGERYEDARVRAKSLDKKHAGDGSPPRSNPSSEVWKLVDRIREA